ncbi:unnamed protein product [Medioppia subpectinata]|uniref:Serine hydroxymethyltransferase-like domain-containing protein n=1 Tax=Medioppia subpectinata TaxID=1979941 RepID=A0A7R9KAR7_9ACAR|nr:unnamed protein product [Medioppia subpectinata]CAG2100028.1 unnamed protein product [Medioppia subpectinata]
MSYKCKNGKIDYDQLEIDAAEFKPSLLVCGASAYPHDFDYKRLRKIAGDAYLMMDMAHISGFIATGIMENAFEHCDIVTTTTHKLLRGPRSAMIFYKKLKNQIVDGKEITIDLKAKIDFAVFPGLQGGPHNQKIGALAVALKQANTQEYKDYCKQVHSNALTLCEEFKKMGYELYSNGTSSHLLLLCLKDVSGIEVERVCELANISINKNCIPTDKSPWNPSAIRIGTPPLTTRGFKESDFVKVAALIDEAIKIATDLSPKTHDNSNKLDLAKLVEAALKDGRILDLKVRVEKFSSHFPIPVFDYRLKK